MRKKPKSTSTSAIPGNNGRKKVRCYMPTSKVKGDIFASLTYYFEMLKAGKVKSSQNSLNSCFYINSVRLGPQCLCNKTTTVLTE